MGPFQSDRSKKDEAAPVQPGQAAAAPAAEERDAAADGLAAQGIVWFVLFLGVYLWIF